MWGKRAQELLAQAAFRTIPTHVGKTRTAAAQKPVTPDHPHACGENKLKMQGHRGSHGPSPRMWGKHYILNELRTHKRTFSAHFKLKDPKKQV